MNKGVSKATPPSSSEDIAGQISSSQTQLGWLQDRVRLTQARDAIEDLQTTVNGLAQRIADLRAHGYVFEKELETKAADFARQWTALYPSVTQQINSQAASLEAALRPLEMQATQLGAAAHNPAAARQLISSINAAMDILKGKVSAAERSIGGMYDQFNNQVYEVTKHLNEVDWMLTQLAEATFGLLPTEGGIMAIKAVWCKSGKEAKDDPEGVLYLTDQRLIFEQKEEIATKKVLFIATEKQKVQQLQWESPVALVESVQTSKQGLLKNEDHIDLRFASGAPVTTAHFHIWQDCNVWQGLINRAKAKEFDKDRAVAIDQAEVEKIKSAPSQCPSCGANITQPILRGMDSIKCEYCGFVIRL